MKRSGALAASLLLLIGGAAAEPRSTSTLVLLGTGTPHPDPRASGPATAVVVGTRVFLVDAGAGVERQLAAAGLPIDGVTALFFTHLHSDHTLGYPDLILTSWVMGRRRPLAAYGPHGLRAMTDHLIAAWAEDIDVRTHGLEHEPPNGYAVNVRELDGGVVYEEDGVKITAVPACHGTLRAFAYRFDTPDRVIVISGDTAPCAPILAASKNVDVLVHEVYAAARLRPEPRPGGQDWPAYMRAFHTSDVELGRAAATAAPRLLVLQHIIRMHATDEELLTGVRAGGFAGRVVVGKDLDRY
jgi:ribonuclease Z